MRQPTSGYLSPARSIARLGKGVPRVVNVLAHKCLMLAYGEDTHRVTPTHVSLAAADTPGVRLASGGWRALRANLSAKWRGRKGVAS